jgi:hypothetical protein
MVLLAGHHIGSIHEPSCHYSRVRCDRDQTLPFRSSRRRQGTSTEVHLKEAHSANRTGSRAALEGGRKTYKVPLSSPSCKISLCGPSAAGTVGNTLHLGGCRTGTPHPRRAIRTHAEQDHEHRRALALKLPLTSVDDVAQIAEIPAPTPVCSARRPIHERYMEACPCEWWSPSRGTVQ